jgi:hypothetical protein
MKAVNNNGIITTYPDVPLKFRSSTGYHLNARSMTADELRNAGLFDVIIDENYDSRIHDLGEIYWDSQSTVFRKDTVDKTWSQTLEELKEQKIANYKHTIGGELSKTDWYIIRQTDSGEVVPTEVTEARQLLRNLTTQAENEINALTTKQQVILYEYPSYES